MKSLILLSLCLTAVLAGPWASQQSELQQQQLEQQLQDQDNRRRLHSLSVKLTEDDDRRREDRLSNRDYDRRDRDREDRDREDRDRYDRDRSDRDRSDRDRSDRDGSDRDRDERDDRRREDRKLRRDDDDRRDNDDDRRDETDDRDDDDDQDQRRSLRSSHLDALARQMDLVAMQYGSSGRVKVAYIPPSKKSSLLAHDLGSLNFRYIPSRSRETVYPSLVKPVLYLPRPDDSPRYLNGLNYNQFLAAPLRNPKIEDRDDDDDDDDNDDQP